METLIYLIGLVVMATLSFVYLNFIWAAYKGAPTVYADTAAITACLNLAKPQPGEMILDLGCGDARSLIIGVKQFQTKGVGVEASLYCVWRARWKVWRAGLSTEIQIVWGDILKSDNLIAQADVIYLYLFPPLLAKLAPRLFGRRKSKSRIVSLAFPIPNHDLLKSTTVKNLGVESAAHLY